MKNRTTLRHANGNQVIIREGWCWLAFIFPLLWAIYYRIWPTVMAFSLIIAIKLIGFTSEGILSSLINFTFNFSYFIGALILGIAGNDMKLQALKSQGYFCENPDQS